MDLVEAEKHASEHAIFALLETFEIWDTLTL
jgi:hypothetical protein